MDADSTTEQTCPNCVYLLDTIEALNEKTSPKHYNTMCDVIRKHLDEIAVLKQTLKEKHARIEVLQHFIKNSINDLATVLKN